MHITSVSLVIMCTHVKSAKEIRLRRQKKYFQIWHVRINIRHRHSGGTSRCKVNTDENILYMNMNRVLQKDCNSQVTQDFEFTRSEAGIFSSAVIKNNSAHPGWICRRNTQRCGLAAVMKTNEHFFVSCYYWNQSLRANIVWTAKCI